MLISLVWKTKEGSEVVLRSTCSDHSMIVVVESDDEKVDKGGTKRRMVLHRRDLLPWCPPVSWAQKRVGRRARHLYRENLANAARGFVMSRI